MPALSISQGPNIAPMIPVAMTNVAAKVESPLTMGASSIATEAAPELDNNAAASNNISFHCFGPWQER